MARDTAGARIATIVARQIFDSRGRPTVEADVRLADSSFGRASVPSGASTGRYEARELRDAIEGDYEGRSVHTAVANVNGEIAAVLQGRSALEQAEVDATLRTIDGTDDLGRLGANAVLATSLGVARAAAAHSGQDLYRYLSSLLGTSPKPSLPMPMTNILSGGAHAGSSMDFQDFLAVPVGASTYSQALEWVSRVRAGASSVLARQGGLTLLADEGGLSPGYRHAEQALELMVQSIEEAGLKPGQQVAIGLDIAASGLYSPDADCYDLKVLGKRLTGAEMLSMIAELCERYPIISVEDPLDQDDWLLWQSFTERFAGKPLQIVGDDLFVTNEERIAIGVGRGIANAVLIKLNQNGTLTGTLRAMTLAREAGYATIVSARSGETEDSFIADLAVASGAGQIKVGSIRSSERQAKYNQLLRIEEDASISFAATAGIAGLGVTPHARRG